MEFHVEDHPDPLDIELLETQIRREASAAMGLGDEVELAIFVRDAGTVVAGISGWTWGDCCELQSLWVAAEPPRSRPRDSAHRRRRSRGGGARVLTDRPLHLRLSGSSPLRAERLRTGGSSRGLPIRNRRPLVPQAPQPTQVAAQPGTVPVREAQREHRRLDDRPRPGSGDAVIQPDGTPRGGSPEAPAECPDAIGYCRNGYRTLCMRGHDLMHRGSLVYPAASTPVAIRRVR